MMARWLEEEEKAKSEASMRVAVKETEALSLAAQRPMEKEDEESRFAAMEIDSEESKSYASTRRLEEKNEEVAHSVGEDDPLGKEGLVEKQIDFFDLFSILGVEDVDILGMRGDEERTAKLQMEMAEPAKENLKAGLVWRAKAQEPEEEEEDSEMMRSDYEAWMAIQFQKRWIAMHSVSFGSFEDKTRFGPMRFTDEPVHGGGVYPVSTLQVFSVKIAIKRCLQWPLDVFGFVAVRDCVDNNRNIIFSRTRNSCQTLTKKDRYLVLTGPTRAVAWPDHATIEVKLTTKGSSESEDKDLSFLAVPLWCNSCSSSYLIRRDHTSKFSNLDFTLGHIHRSVEATIFVQVIDGSWPDGVRGQFSAFATGTRHKILRTIDDQKIVLLDSRGEKVPIIDGSKIQLSRSVVSVEIEGKLKVCVTSWKTSERGKNVEDEWVFTPQEANRSYGRLDTGFCKMKVTVAWSLISSWPDPLEV